MPIYEYRCQECNQIFEEWQKDFCEKQYPCPVCGGESERLISNTSFVLKGSGWYVTDYCGKNAASASASGNGNNGTAKKEAESKPAKEPAPAKDSTPAASE